MSNVLCENCGAKLEVTYAKDKPVTIKPCSECTLKDISYGDLPMSMVAKAGKSISWLKVKEKNPLNKSTELKMADTQ